MMSTNSSKFGRTLTPEEVVALPSPDKDYWMVNELQVTRRGVGMTHDNVKSLQNSMTELTTKVENLTKDIADNAAIMEKFSSDVFLLSDLVAKLREEAGNPMPSTSRAGQSKDSLKDMYKILKLVYEGDLRLEDNDEVGEVKKEVDVSRTQRRFSNASTIEYPETNREEPRDDKGGDVLEILQDDGEKSIPKSTTVPRTAETGGSKQASESTEQRGNTERQKSSDRYPAKISSGINQPSTSTGITERMSKTLEESSTSVAVSHTETPGFSKWCAKSNQSEEFLMEMDHSPAKSTRSQKRCWSTEPVLPTSVDTPTESPPDLGSQPSTSAASVPPDLGTRRQVAKKTTSSKGKGKKKSMATTKKKTQLPYELTPKRQEAKKLWARKARLSTRLAQEEIARLKAENEQLKATVAELSPSS